MPHSTDRKICKVCGDEKLLEDFYRHPGTRDGRFATCIPCFRAYRKTLYQVTGRRDPAPRIPVGGRWNAVR